MRLVLPLLLFPLVPALAQECLPLRPEVVTVQGTVAQGPAPRGGGQGKSMILMLDKAVCLQSHPKKVRELELIITSDQIKRSLPHMLRDKVRVRGKISPASDTHPVTPFLIDVEALIKAP